MKEEIQLTLNEASESLKDAQVLLSQNRFKASVSRSYLAFYHAAKAALVSINIETYTHQGVNIQFAKHFIKTGIFEKSLIQAFSKMLETRLKADYEVGFNASQEDCQEAYKQAFELYNLIFNYLSTENI